MPPLVTRQAVNPLDSYFRVFLYGDTGTGKTLLTGSVVRHKEMAPVLYVNFDDGLASLAHIPGISYVRPNSLAEIAWLKAQLAKPEASRDKTLQGIKTIVIDSISAGRDQMLAELVAKGMANAKNPRTEAVLQVQDYGHMQFAMTDFVSSLRQQPYHIIATAGIKYEYTGDQITGASPLLNPGVLQSVNHMMSFIWATTKSGGRYKLYTGDKGIYLTKTRNPRMVRAINAQTEELAKKAGSSAPQSQIGWYTLGLDENDLPTPGLDNLYDLFVASTATEK